MSNLAGILKNILTCRTRRKKNAQKSKKLIFLPKMSLQLFKKIKRVFLEIRLSVKIWCYLTYFCGLQVRLKKTGVLKNEIFSSVSSVIWLILTKQYTLMKYRLSVYNISHFISSTVLSMLTKFSGHFYLLLNNLLENKTFS